MIPSNHSIRLDMDLATNDYKFMDIIEYRIFFFEKSKTQLLIESGGG
jgi:hypothetical protein